MCSSRSRSMSTSRKFTLAISYLKSVSADLLKSGHGVESRDIQAEIHHLKCLRFCYRSLLGDSYRF